MRKAEDWFGREKTGAGVRGAEALRRRNGGILRGIQLSKIKKEQWGLPMGIAAAGAALALAVTLLEGTGGRSGILTRPQWGEGTKTARLEVREENGDRMEVSVAVEERRLSRAEREQAFREAKDRLEQEMLGNNESPDEVYENLVFPDRLEGSPVLLEWHSLDYELIAMDGQVQNETLRESRVVPLRVRMVCGEEERSVSLQVCVQPRRYSAEEARRISLQGEAEKALREQAEEAQVTLPRTVEGTKVLWKQKEERSGVYLLFLGIGGALLVVAGREQDRKKALKQSEQMLEEDYPEIVSRLVLLAGIGIPVRKAFFRIAEEYEKKRTEETRRPAYEELVRVCREMEAGCTEQQAYEAFGRRCRLPRYRKCAALLSQNMRQGADGLLRALQEETAEAFEEKKRRARKRGEEAGTRLLLPMLLLLLMIMLLILAPAVFSFGEI